MNTQCQFFNLTCKHMPLKKIELWEMFLSIKIDLVIELHYCEFLTKKDQDNFIIISFLLF